MNRMAERIELMRQAREQLTQLSRALLPGGDSMLGAATDEELVTFTVEAEKIGRFVDSLRVSAAGEIEQRSRFELGSHGLSFGLGHRKAYQLIEYLTRTSQAEARRRVRLGTAVQPRVGLDGESLPPEHPLIADALGAGEIGVESAARIARCMDDARRTASVDDVSAAEEQLVAAAARDGADSIGVQAVVWREFLDPDGAEPRDERLHRKRSFRLGLESNGMTPFSGALDPVGAALLKSAFGEASKPGVVPRFLTEDDRHAGTTFVTDIGGTTSEQLVDPRSRDQRQYDVFMGLLKAGTRSTGTEPGGMRSTATVTAVITLDDLRSGAGVGWLEHVVEPVSAATIETLVCGNGFTPMIVGDAGEALFLGQLQRFFSWQQMRALAVRDGGCVWPTCNAPPGECDGHHVRPFTLEGGPTDIDNGKSFKCDPCPRACGPRIL